MLLAVTYPKIDLAVCYEHLVELRLESCVRNEMTQYSYRYFRINIKYLVVRSPSLHIPSKPTLQ